jgi:pantetheine-phosphate adenylyltransferase
LGHLDIIQRSIPLFDEIIIGVGTNSEKKYMFPLDKRIDFIKNTFAEFKSISVTQYEGLTIEFCKKVQADFIIRGLRNPADFEFEKAIAHTNRKMSGIETVFLLTAAKTSFISSSIVREIISNQGDYTQLVPATVRV